jgi:hypothetical protein
MFIPTYVIISRREEGILWIELFSLFLFSDCSFLVYRKATDLGMVILYPTTLSKCFSYLGVYVGILKS